MVRKIAFASLMVLAAGAQQPPIRVPVRVVLVPTLVFSKKGQYVDGLQAGDFRVYDAGRPQKFTLETEELPIAAAIAIQSNRDTRDYIQFISKVGSILDDSIRGLSGQVAVLAYNEDISVLKPFDAGSVDSALKDLRAQGSGARMIDAGAQAVKMLKQIETRSMRVLIFVGQAMDHGSREHLDALNAAAEREDVSVYCLKLPLAGKAFIADTLSFAGKDSSGMQAGVELTKGIPVLRRAELSRRKSDPFSILSASTGGMEIPFHKQSQLEDALIALGASLRSRYLLSYSPDSTQLGYHKISVKVDKPGVIVYSRAGYTMETR